MKNQQILEKAIQKAIDSGWEPGDKHDLDNLSTIEAYIDAYSPCSYIFNHDFAKALWGTELIDVNIGTPKAFSVEAWQFHIQEMVISEDPIKYLGENI